jgi:sodium transport system permease protein
MTFEDLAKITIVTQLVMVLAPAAIMSLTLTRDPRRTFRLQRPRWMALPAAGLLAITLFPLIMAAHFAVAHVHQPRPEVQQFSQILQAKLNSTPVGLAVILVALLPAVCEELTFRGFILSGFRHTGHKWRAIVLTSLFFAVTHPIMQQQVNAFFLGLILGYLAIQTGSIWPPIIYHFVHNATAYLSSRFAILERVASDDLYAGLSLFVGTMCSVILVFWFHELQYRRTKEEALQEAIDREAAGSLGPA